MKHFLTILFFTIFISVSSFAQQKDTVNVVSDYGVGEGSLNTAVQTAITAGTLSNTVFKLESFGLYILNGTVTTPLGQVLTIVGPPVGLTQNSAPPQIVWTSSGGVTTTFNFDCGGDVVLKNVWLLYANTGGAQVGSCFEMEDDSLADLAGKGEIGNFNNVIFDYSDCSTTSGGAITISTKHFHGTFTNCYFRNCTDPHYRYYGRALSFPYNTTGYHTDDVTFENCTFANMGYTYMQEGGEYADNVNFNHCTFINIAMFPLESGWWHNLAVTNCIFQNAFMFGSIPAQDTSGGNGGTFAIGYIKNFGFTPTFAEADRHILFTNSSYFIEAWLTSWMTNNPYSVSQHKLRLDDLIPVPQVMLNKGTIAFFDSIDATTGLKEYPHMNRMNLYDATDPGFVTPPTNLDSLKKFLYHKWSDNADCNWAYQPTNDLQQVWPITENLSYTNNTLKTGGMGSFPLGDLYHWFPAIYTQWKAQATAEDAAINKLLMNGITSVKQQPGLPTSFSLSQNYPNPFNPTTKINYSIPKTGFVSLKVYNIIGQEVETLFNGLQQPGNYSATFDGKNLTSGVYFYRLQSESASITKKFVLIK
jgi:uncharacterized membrane protein YccF (DUF307 family)